MAARIQAQALAAPLFVVLWSTGFIGAKFGLPYAEPMTFLALRFSVVAALLLGWAAISGEAGGGRYDWRGALAIGVLIHGVYLGGVFTAIWLGVGAALSALIVGLQPIATALIAGAMLGERLRGAQWLGMALGVGGVALVVWRRLGMGEIDWRGVALCVLGLLAISLGSVLQKRRSGETRLAFDSGVQFLGAAAATGIFALLFETRRIAWTGEFLFAFAWMVCVLSLGAISILYFLIRRGGVARLSSLFFLVPGVTAAMAWAMFGETYGPLEFAGLVLAAVGVALVVQPFRAST